MMLINQSISKIINYNYNVNIMEYEKNKFQIYQNYINIHQKQLKLYIQKVGNKNNYLSAMLNNDIILYESINKIYNQLSHNNINQAYIEDNNVTITRLRLLYLRSILTPYDNDYIVPFLLNENLDISQQEKAQNMLHTLAGRYATITTKKSLIDIIHTFELNLNINKQELTQYITAYISKKQNINEIISYIVYLIKNHTSNVNFNMNNKFLTENNNSSIYEEIFKEAFHIFLILHSHIELKKMNVNLKESDQVLYKVQREIYGAQILNLFNRVIWTDNNDN